MKAFVKLVPGDLVMTKYAQQRFLLPASSNETFAYARAKPDWDSVIVHAFNFWDLMVIIAYIKNESEVWYLAMNHKGLICWISNRVGYTSVITYRT